jgi:hypothetical protein
MMKADTVVEIHRQQGKLDGLSTLVTLLGGTTLIKSLLTTTPE